MRCVAVCDRVFETLAHLLVDGRHLGRIHAQDMRAPFFDRAAFELIVLHDEVEVRDERRVQIIFKALGVLTRHAQDWAKAAGAIVRECVEHFFFRLEVIVEGAAREIGAADDVAHGRGLVAKLGEHSARGYEDRLPVGDLGLFAFAYRLDVGRRFAHLFPRMTLWSSYNVTKVTKRQFATMAGRVRPW